MREFIGRGDIVARTVQRLHGRVSRLSAPGKSTPMKSARRRRLNGCRRTVLGNRRGHGADAKPEEN
jgi:hypothetical protein